jgi:HSP20 family protein
MPQLLRRSSRNRLAPASADFGFPWARPLLSEFFDIGRDVLFETYVPIDMTRTDDAITVVASIPGIDPDQIDVTLDRGVLTISGTSTGKAAEEGDSYIVRERRIGSFERSLRLPRGVDAGAATSNYANGELTVQIPLVEDHKPQRIQISKG